MPFTGLSVSDCAYFDPVDRHRVRARHVAEDDRRLHVARAVALHPAVVGERVAVHLLAEVLDHVVALGLAVHQHVEADLLLQADHALDLRPSSGRRGQRPRRSRPSQARRAVRISAVCGNEPIVVVGKSGRPSARAGRRGGVANGLALRVGLGHGRASRSRTAGCACAGLRAVLERLAVLSSSAEIASRPSFSARAQRPPRRASARERIQRRTSASRRGSLRLSTGECSSEQEVETTTRSPRRSQLLEQVEAARGR